MKKTLLIAATLLTAACTERQTPPDTQAADRAKGFAEAYFNYDFKTALPMATPESLRWLQFAASNITQQDVDQLNAQQALATADITGLEWTDDTTATVTVAVGNYLQKDSIGRPMRLVDEAEFLLTVVERQGQYLVRMEGLPRSERQSRGSAGDE